jgi:thioredoxin domain-containing protein 5
MVHLPLSIVNTHNRFIKHFSPYCKHCRELAPIWNDLADKKSKQYPGRLHFAQVDCVANGDLCSEHGINAYPDLQW